MVEQRSSEITRALGGKRQRVCFIFGALGRQGNTGILDRLIKKIEGIFEYMVLIAS
jgi:diphthamide synthase subunit DPH2